MKPFNIKEAKAGMPVCTKSGKSARIICFDAKVNSNETNMIVLVDEGNTEIIYTYNNNGTPLYDSDDYDLMMKPEHHIGYINVHKCGINNVLACSVVYEVYDQAKKAVKDPNGDIKTLKIEWEE